MYTKRNKKCCNKRLNKKIRKIVVLFRKSPTKNDKILQKYVVEQFGKEKSLILDTKTRWNSLVHMIERFVLLKSCIMKSLIDLNSEILFNEKELETATSIVSILQPIKLAEEALCRKESNLLTCDVVIKFMLKKINLVNTNLSCEIETALRFQLQKRRTIMSSVLHYLHNGPDFETDKDDLF